MRGSLSTQSFANELGITTEGARFQLNKLAEEALVQAENSSGRVGRPTQIWTLTQKGNGYFQDNHADFSVQLLDSMKEVLGEAEMNKIITLREKKANSKYVEALQNVPGLEAKIARLAELRNTDGYLAEWDKDGEAFILIENHCPVCAAAQRCADLCDAEMNTFREIFGEGISIERIDHIITGSRRCAYRIKNIEPI